MTEGRPTYVFGPVPSRRLGRSLGVDLVPFKTCTHDCVYCQLGRTTELTVERRDWVPVEAVLEQLGRTLAAGVTPDVIGVAGSGEPTLHRSLGRVLRSIKSMTRFPVAVLTNGSLLSSPEVREDLQAADFVLPSLCAATEGQYRRIARPHETLSLERTVEGLAAFTRSFSGEVWLEVFALAGETDGDQAAELLAALARRVAPARVHLATITRPPSEPDSVPVAQERLRAMAGRFSGRVDVVGGDEPRVAGFDPPSPAGRAEVLALLARRPCTTAEVAHGLGLTGSGATVLLEALAADGSIEGPGAGSSAWRALRRPLRR